MYAYNTHISRQKIFSSQRLYCESYLKLIIIYYDFDLNLLKST